MPDVTADGHLFTLTDLEGAVPPAILSALTFQTLGQSAVECPSGERIRELWGERVPTRTHYICQNRARSHHCNIAEEPLFSRLMTPALRDLIQRRPTVYKFSREWGVPDVNRKLDINLKEAARVINPVALDPADVEEMYKTYHMYHVTKDGCEMLSNRFGQQVPPDEQFRAQYNIARLMSDPDLLNGIEAMLGLWNSVRCSTLFTIMGKHDPISAKVEQIKVVSEMLDLITREHGLILPEELTTPPDYTTIDDLLFLEATLWGLLEPNKYGGGPFGTSIPDGDGNDLQKWISGAGFMLSGDLFEAIGAKQTLKLTLLDGREFELALPDDLVGLAKMIDLETNGERKQQFLDAFSRQVTIQWQGLIALCASNLYGITGNNNQGVTSTFEWIKNQVAYFDHISALAAHAVTSVTQRGCNLTMPVDRTHVPESSDAPMKITDLVTMNPPREMGQEVPNSTFFDRATASVVVATTSGGKTHFFEKALVQARIAAGLGAPVFAEEYVFAPEGRVLNPCSKSDVDTSKGGLAGTVQLVKEVSAKLAPTSADVVIWSEIGGGATNEGGEVEFFTGMSGAYREREICHAFITHSHDLATRVIAGDLPDTQVVYAGMRETEGSPVSDFKFVAGTDVPWALYDTCSQSVMEAARGESWFPKDESPLLKNGEQLPDQVAADPDSEELRSRWKDRSLLRTRINKGFVTIGELADHDLTDFTTRHPNHYAGRYLSPYDSSNLGIRIDDYFWSKNDRLKDTVVDPCAFYLSGAGLVYADHWNRLLTKEGIFELGRRCMYQMPANTMEATHHNITRLIADPELMDRIDAVVAFWSSFACNTIFYPEDKREGQIGTMVDAVRAVAFSLPQIIEQAGLVVPEEYPCNVELTSIYNLLPLTLMLSVFEKHDMTGTKVLEAIGGSRLGGLVKSDANFTRLLSGFLRSAELRLQPWGTDTPITIDLKDIDYDGVRKLYDQLQKVVGYFDYLGALVSKSVNDLQTRPDATLTLPIARRRDTSSNTLGLSAEDLKRPSLPKHMENDVPNNTDYGAALQLVCGPNGGGKSYGSGSAIDTRIQIGMGGFVLAKPGTCYYDPGGRMITPSVPAYVEWYRTKDKHLNGYVERKDGMFGLTCEVMSNRLNELAPNPSDTIICDEVDGGIVGSRGASMVARGLIEEARARGFAQVYISHNRGFVDEVDADPMDGLVLTHAGIEAATEPEGRPTLSHKMTVGAPDWSLYAKNVTGVIDDNLGEGWFHFVNQFGVVYQG